MSDDEDRFWGKVTIGDGCWEWQACGSREGYGRFGLGGRVLLAHRVSWTFANGPIPAGMHVLHRCDNPACVRPGHLFLGTNDDNIADMDAKGRRKGGVGSRHGSAKLTEADVPKARALVASGMTQREAGKLLGVSRWTVGRIVRGKTWRHVEDEEEAEFVRQDDLSRSYDVAKSFPVQINDD